MRRIVLRVWLRGAWRQRARAIVVVLTLAVMTVGTTAALVAGDSLEQLFIEDARAEWGDVDVEVTNPGDGVFSLSRGRFIAVESGPAVGAWAPRLILPTVATLGDRTQPDGLVLGLPPEDQFFPPMEAIAGSVAYLELEPGQVIVNDRLARRLDLEVGDQLDLVVGVPQVVLREESDDEILTVRDAVSVDTTVEVAGIAADRRVADLHRTPNVLMRLDQLQRLTALDTRVNVLHLGATDDTVEAARRLERDVDALARIFDLDAEPVLLDQLAIADDEGGQNSSILMTLALLVIVAAGIAAAQMMTSLAEDRSDEIAVLRTLGTTRRTVQRLVAAEATVYAAVAVALGLWFALPVADLISTALADHFAALSAGRGREQARLVATHDPATLATGALIVLVTAALSGRSAGRRLASVDVDELLRGPIERLPDPVLHPWRPVVLGMLGSMLVGMGLLGGAASDALRFLGLTLLGTAWWAWRRRQASTTGTHPTRDEIDQRFAWGALGWSIVGAALLADFGQGYETGFGMLVVAGVTAVTASAVLLVPRFRRIMRLVRLYAPSGAWQVALRTAGAWAQETGGRTARVHATFGIVLFLAAALHVLGNAQALPAARQSGGFDVIATSVVGLDTPQLRRIDGVQALAAVPSALIPEDAYGSRPPNSPDAPLLRLRYPVRLAAGTPDLAALQDFRLAAALPEYATAREALDAVSREADKIVVDRYGLPPGARVGDDLVFEVGADERSFQLIAVLDTFLLDTAFVNVDEFHRLASSPGANLVLARAAPSTTPASLRDNLEEAQRSRGLTGDTIDEAVADVVAVNRTFTDVFALMLLLGLAVAVVAVGASLARSARERARNLAVLRVMGVPRWALAVTLASEPIVVGAVGSLAGLVVGLGVLRALFLVGFQELAFVLDVPLVASALAALIGLLVVLCLLTAWPASRVDAADHAD